jgi:hypothetical protein
MWDQTKRKEMGHHLSLTKMDKGMHVVKNWFLEEKANHRAETSPRRVRFVETDMEVMEREDDFWRKRMEGYVPVI